MGFGGLGRRAEGDLLAERRARRAAESGKDALTHRAEAAEATMQTLQAHVMSLQERLREAEEEHQRLSELVAARGTSEPWAPPATEAGERELRHAKQRSYAEQQLRADTEERLRDVEASTRAEVERVGRLLATREREAHAVAQELDGVRRELAEAEQAVASERAALRRVERDLQERLGELERRTAAVDRDLDAERRARERAERMLESMARGHRLMQVAVGELRDLVARLTAAFAADALARAAQTHAAQPPVPGSLPVTGTAGEHVGAAVSDFSQASGRATPVVRSSGPADEPAPAHAPRERPSPPAGGRPIEPRLDAPSRSETQRASEEMADALAEAVARLRARAGETATPAADAGGRPNRHSMSLIGRWRAALRRRRQA